MPPALAPLHARVGTISDVAARLSGSGHSDYRRWLLVALRVLGHHPTRAVPSFTRLPPRCVRFSVVRYAGAMLFMVIERFNSGAAPVGERFQRQGRMMPGGVSYHGSWIDPAALRCFQVMEATSRDLLDEWISHWSDLVEFEVIPVTTSADFWATR